MVKAQPVSWKALKNIYFGNKSCSEYEFQSLSLNYLFIGKNT